MSHPYGEEAEITLLLGTDLEDVLVVVDENTDAQDVYDQAREDADVEIDSALAKIYVVPFAAITDATPTPGIIHKISNYFTASNLLFKRHPEASERWRKRALDNLAPLIDGIYEVPGATKVDPEDGKVGFAYSASTPTFGGHAETDDGQRSEDDLGDRMDGL